MNKLNWQFFLLALTALFFAVFASACTFPTSENRTNSQIFKNTADFDQRVARVQQMASDQDTKQAKYTENDVMLALGVAFREKNGAVVIKKDVSIRDLSPGEVYLYRCGSSTSLNCLGADEFMHLYGKEVAFVQAPNSITIHPSFSATFHQAGYNLKVVAIFDDRDKHLVHPRKEGLAVIDQQETVYVTDLLSQIFRGVVSTGASTATHSGIGTVLP